MTRFIPPLAIAAATGGADAGTRLLEGQPIGMTTAITVTIAVATFGIWLEHRLSRIEQKLKDLPCQTNGCPVTKKHRKK